MRQSLETQCSIVHKKLEEPGKLVKQFAQDFMDRFYIIKFRIKSVESMAGKFERSRRKGYKMGHPKELTDLLGLRVVTTFRSELPLALALVLKCVNKQQGYPYNLAPFTRRSINEIIFYDSEKEGIDPAAIDEKIRTMMPLYGVRKYYMRKQSKREYSSIHVSCTTAPQDTYWPLGGPSVEVQVRTIFEDAWCEIDHKYNYRLVRETASSAHEQQLAALHLPTFRLTQALRTQQDAAARIADQIFQIGARNRKGPL